MSTTAPEQNTPNIELTHEGASKWDIRERPELVLVPALFVVFVALWELLINALEVSELVLPKPSSIWASLTNFFQDPIFWGHFWVTTQETFVGFLIAAFVAITLGTLVSQIPLVEKTVMPYVVAFQAVPKVALAPLFLLWFGFGMTSKIVMSAVIAFFPILINVIEGLRSAEVERLRMLTVFGASKWQLFVKVRLPSAMPFIFAGLDVGLLLALLGAVVGEFVGGGGLGLGSLVLQTNFNFDIPGQFAVLIILSVMGLFAHAVVRGAQKRFAFWAESSRITGT